MAARLLLRPPNGTAQDATTDCQSQERGNELPPDSVVVPGTPKRHINRPGTSVPNPKWRVFFLEYRPKQGSARTTLVIWLKQNLEHIEIQECRNNTCYKRLIPIRNVLPRTESPKPLQFIFVFYLLVNFVHCSKVPQRLGSCKV